MKRILFNLIMLLSIPVLAQDSLIQLSLADCYTLAINNTPLSAAIKLINEGSDAGISAIQTAHYPQVNMQARASYQSEAISIPELVPGMPVFNLSKDQYKGMIDISQMIYDGGVVHSAEALLIAQSAGEIAQTKVQLDAIKQQLNGLITTKMLLQKRLEVLKLTILNLQQQLKSLDKAVENGIILQTDKDKVQLALLKVKQQKMEAEASFHSAAQSLNHLLGLSGNQRVIVDINLPALPDDPDYQNRAETNYFKQQLSVIDANIALNNSNRKPKIAAAVQGGYGRPGLNLLDDTFQPWYFAGITLSWSPWDWKKTEFQNQNFEVQKKLILNRQENFEYNLDNARLSYLVKIDALQNSLALDDSILSLQNQIVATESDKLNLGMSTATDYILAINSRKEAMLLKKTHEIQLLKSKLDYLNILGLPKLNNNENK